MKGKELVEFIQQNNLEDFDIKLKVWDFKGEKTELRKFIIGDITGKYIDTKNNEAVLFGSEDIGLRQNLD
jgi:hypothetical protein